MPNVDEPQPVALHMPELISLHERIQEFTNDLFGISSEVVAETDPETAEKYFAVAVTTSEAVAEIVRHSDVWHRRIGDIAGDAACFFRLALDIR